MFLQGFCMKKRQIHVYMCNHRTWFPVIAAVMRSVVSFYSLSYHDGDSIDFLSHNLSAFICFIHFYVIQMIKRTEQSAQFKMFNCIKESHSELQGKQWKNTY